LIQKVSDVILGLETAYDHDLIASSDPFIFDWARRSGVSAVISADRDFIQLAERFGPPRKVIQARDKTKECLDRLSTAGRVLFVR
jgi:predicted nuclease of predicted toxin-antitoxin system